MSAKSVLEADGKAILNYHLTRAPPITTSTLPPPPHNAPPKLASLYFPEDAAPEGVIQTAEATYPWLLAPDARFVGKPDQLIKRRGKSGLLTLNKPWEEVKQWILERAGKKVIVDDKVPGYLRNFLVEPFVPHKQNEEYYVNIMSLREGDEILFTHEGGVDVGNVREKAKSIIIPVDLKEYPSNDTLISTLLPDVPSFVHNVLIDFINRLYAVYVDSQFTYLEINPLVVIPNEDATSASIHFLDLAAKIDQTAEFECGAKWAVARSPAALGITAVGGASGKIDIDAGPPLEFPAPFGREMSKEEAYIAALDAKTGASLKLTVLNSQGRIWTLVAGGGASVVYADAIMGALDDEERALKDAIKAEQNLPADTPYDQIPLDDPPTTHLANYGEYSGAPTETQTYHYARTAIDLMLRAPLHPRGKVLFIGGGIANFTNVASTFKGVIKALREFATLLNEHNVQIWVRRAGPNYQEGLKNIKAAGDELKLQMKVYGPEMGVAEIVPVALKGETTKVKEYGEI